MTTSAWVAFHETQFDNAYVSRSYSCAVEAAKAHPGSHVAEVMVRGGNLVVVGYHGDEKARGT